MDCDELKDYVSNMVLASGFTRCAFLSPFAPEKFNVKNIEPTNSLLICALPYGNEKDEVCIPVNCGKDAVYGIIAPFARYNYYKEAVKRLQKISKQLREQYGGEKKDYRIFCNSRIPEKTIACECGLGTIGRNSLLITPEAGSLVVIAAMTLPFYLSNDGSACDFTPCANCDKNNPPCAAACPQGAVNALNKTIDLKKCIQWYASGNGESVPPEVQRVWGNRFYGCVNCQDACVQNKKPVSGTTANYGAVEAFIEINSFLTLPDTEKLQKFKNTALGMSWLGAAALRRNALMVLQSARASVKD